MATTITVLMATFGMLLWQSVAPYLGAPFLPFAPLTVALAALLLFGLCACVWALIRPIPADEIARELDRRMELGDRAATAVAVLRGQVTSPLAEHVIEDAERTLRVALPGVRAAFPARPGRTTLRQIKRLTILVAVVVVGAWIAGELPGGAPFSWGLLGKGTGADAPIPVPAAGQNLDSGPTGSETSTPPDPDDDSAGDDSGDDSGQGTAETPPNGLDPNVRDPDVPAAPDQPQEPEGEREAGARVTVTPQFERFRQQDPVIVVVSAFPTVDLTQATTYRLELTLDGRSISTDRRVRVDPERPAGAAEMLDLSTLPEAAAALTPGEHTLTATAVPDDGSRPGTSQPVTFHVLGPPGDGEAESEADSEGGDGPAPPDQEDPQDDPNGQGAPPPPPPPETPTEPPPEGSEPPPFDEPSPDGDAPPPPGSDDAGDDPDGPPPPTPEFPVDFEEQLVVPLFGAGETVTKHGPRLVLVPGTRPDQRARRPLRDALAEARAHAEASVDRARWAAEDRELVRRYFERLFLWLK